MKRMHRFAAVLLVLGLGACAPDDEEMADAEGAAEQVDMPAASAAPADLQARSDAYLAAWNAEDPDALAAFFAENATAADNDTLTFTGRQEIRDGWVAEALPVLSNLQISDETWEAMGSDWVNRGRYTYTLNVPDQPEMQASGTYEAVWTRGADGNWVIRSSTTRDDAPPM